MDDERIPGDLRPGYHANAVYTLVRTGPQGEVMERIQLCARYNRGFCQQGYSRYCVWLTSRDRVRVLHHLCNFVLPCSQQLCGSTEHTAKEHSSRPAHCFHCHNHRTAARDRARPGPTFSGLH